MSSRARLANAGELPQRLDPAELHALLPPLQELQRATKLAVSPEVGELGFELAGAGYPAVAAPELCHDLVLATAAVLLVFQDDEAQAFDPFALGF